MIVARSQCEEGIEEMLCDLCADKTEHQKTIVPDDYEIPKAF
jgi:hypothetical protein